MVFGITQKLDPIVLKAIGILFDIKIAKKPTHFSIDTTNPKTIKKISNYFFKTMKGMKSFEYRIWARSFDKKEKSFKYLLKIQKLMQKIRLVRFNEKN